MPALIKNIFIIIFDYFYFIISILFLTVMESLCELFVSIKTKSITSPLFRWKPESIAPRIAR